SQDGLMQQYGVHHIDWLRDSPCGRLAQQLIDQGFSWDYISDAQLVASHAKEGGIQTPGEDYRVIVVPATRRMPVETLARLREFAAQGVPVLFEALPDD